MSYGIIKVDTITFTDGGVDKSIQISGLVQNPTFSGNVTCTGTISGVTITGSVAQFTTITGGSAGFTTVTGTTVTGTTANFVSGVFTSQISGTTVTGTTASFTSGNFTNISGGTHTITSGVFASGTAANPSISFVGDADTGIYASAANQISITTSGTERLRVDAAGQIESASLGTAAAPAYSFTADPNTGIYSPGADQVAISTNGTERLFVNASGNVGVGTSVPVNNSVTLSRASGYVEYRVVSASNSASLSVDGSVAYLGTNNSLAQIFITNGTERARIDSSGRLGLGTSSPGTNLHIAGTGNARATIESTNSVNADILFTTAGTLRGVIGYNSTAGGLNLDYGRGTGPLTFSYVGAEVARFDASGRLGIGTTSPTEILHTVSSSGSVPLFEHVTSSALKLTKTITGTESRIQFANTADTKAGQMRINWAQDSFGAFETWVPNNTSNGQAITIRSSTDNTIFYGSAAGTERARLDSSGRLLVGTSSNLTGAQLQVAGALTGGQALSSLNSFAASSQLNLDRASAGTTAVIDTNLLGSVQYRGYDGTNYIVAASIGAAVDGTPGTNDMPGRLVFSTTADGASSPTERMRIKNNGDMQLFQSATSTPGLNNTTTGIGIEASTGAVFISRASDAGNLWLNSNAASGSATAVFFMRSGTAVGTISTTTTATAYNTSSDYRLKENIVPLTGAANRLNQLQVHRFNFIADPDTTVDGFIAHEAQAVVPECVTGTKDEVDDDGSPVYQGIDQSKLVPLLTAALQEALQKIEALETRLTAAGL